MHIVLVGGSGFLGQFLVHELVADGHTCTVLSRHADRHLSIKLAPGTRLVQADVYDTDALARISPRSPSSSLRSRLASSSFASA